MPNNAVHYDNDTQLLWWLLNQLEANPAPLLLICESSQTAQTWYERLRQCLPSTCAVWLCAAPLGVEPNAWAQWYHFLHHALVDQLPPVVVLGQAWLRRSAMPLQQFLDLSMQLRTGVDFDRKALLQRFLQCGYRHAACCEQVGQYRVLGGIIDIFPPQSPCPLRLDFFGDTLQTMQWATGHRPPPSDWMLYPIAHVAWDTAQKNHAKILLTQWQKTYGLPNQLIKSTCEAIERGSTHIDAEFLYHLYYLQPLTPALTYLQHTTATWTYLDKNFDANCREIASTPHLFTKLPPTLLSKVHPSSHLRDFLTIRQATAFSQLGGQAPMSLRAIHWPPTAGLGNNSGGGGGEALAACLQRYQSLRIWIGTGNLEQAKWVQKALHNQNMLIEINTQPLQHFLQKKGLRKIVIGITPLSGSAINDNEAVLLLDSKAFFPMLVRHTRAAAVANGFDASIESTMQQLQKLQIDQIVIHKNHGVAKFLGIKRLELSYGQGDFLSLQFANQERLYMPIYQVNLLYPAAPSASLLKLDSLSKSKFLALKNKIKNELLHLAHEIVTEQAKRKLAQGPVIAKPNVLYQQMVEAFAFEETPDQAVAIAQVEQDLQRPYPMDRLICADVGFGKTEVALRATMLAVSSGHQVAVLVPTTVLAAQHARTFTDRLAPFGVQIAQLNRTVMGTQKAKLLQSLQQGMIDVVIGTHALLQNEVQFKQLGLVVVDEEQRFGVGHKEKIRKMGRYVHLLTLSATPIPRTLQMATTGLKDISLITTPPKNRHTIHTEVLSFDESKLKQALAFELARGGQAFVLYHRIDSIHRMEKLLHKLLPEANIDVVHGKLDNVDIERRMLKFVHNQTQILLCTSIVESGIDLPHVNSIVICRADLYGLAQLHQLRGRVGRGDVQAYAYLMVPKRDLLGDEAAQRLALLQRFSQLGAGFKIATADLDQRGGGELLGRKQAGNMLQLGHGLYTELLAEAMQSLAPHATNALGTIESDLKIPLPAYLPEDYIQNPSVRLQWYQQLMHARDTAELRSLLDQLIWRFGPLPEVVQNLAQLVTLRQILRHAGIKELQLTALHQDFTVKAVFDLRSRCLQSDKLPQALRECRLKRVVIANHGVLTGMVPYADCQGDVRLAVNQVQQTMGDLLRACLQNQLSLA